MCDYCKDTFKNLTDHTIIDCPLRKGAYCCLCACYGHIPRNCIKDKIHLEPQFLEQLIPPSLLEENGINTNTPIISTKQLTKFPTIQRKSILHYKDDPKFIHDLLKSLNDLPRKEQRGREKYKDHLIKFAKRHNLDLVEIK